MPLHDAVRARCEAHRRSLFLDAGVFGSNVVREVRAFFRPLQKKGFKEERVTSMRLNNLSTCTTLEYNKSL